MAYFDENDENDTAVSPSQQATSGESAFVSGSAVGSDRGQQGQAATSAQGTPDDPGNFVGIKDYINANKPQSQKLASQVGQGVTELGNQARAATGQAETQFNQDVDQNTVKADDNLVNQVKTSANTLSADQRAQVNRDKAAQYKGPADLTSSQYYQPAAASVQKAQQQADLTKTEAGQREILKPMEQKAQHGSNQGINTFNSMLLQAAPNAREELANARQSVSDLPEMFQTTLSNAFQKASGAQQTTADAAKAYQDAIQQGVTGAGSSMNKSYEDYQALNDYGNRIHVDINDDTLDPETLALYGLDKGTNLYDLDLNTYLKNYTGQPLSKSQVVSPEDYAKFRALKELGGNFDFELDESAGNNSPFEGVSVDPDKLRQDLASRKSSFETELAPLIPKLSAAQQAYKEAGERLASYVPMQEPQYDLGWRAHARAAAEAKAALQTLQQQKADIESKYKSSRTVK